MAAMHKPIKGATYSGTLNFGSNVTFRISFKVSKNGKSVSGFKLPQSPPFYCQGGGFPHIGKSPRAKVSKKGTFTAKLPLLAIGTNKPDGSVIVTGKFGKHGKESGKVKTAIAGKFGSQCNGSSSYSTTG